MPVFTYQAVGDDGRKSNGTLSANNRATALDRIANMGLYPTQVAEETDRRKTGRTQAANTNGSRGPSPSTRLSPAATETFTRELADLLAAGVPLARSLQIIRREARAPFDSVTGSALSCLGDLALAVSLASFLSNAGKLRVTRHPTCPLRRPNSGALAVTRLGPRPVGRPATIRANILPKWDRIDEQLYRTKPQGHP